MKKFDELRKLLEKYTEVNFVNRDDEGFIIDRVRIDRNDLLALLADREQLRETLKFYADYMNYCIDYETNHNGFTRICILYKDIEERNEVTGLAGKRARAALKKSDEVENG